MKTTGHRPGGLFRVEGWASLMVVLWFVGGVILFSQGLRPRGGEEREP